ncbi:MAG: ABC transporter ATP-binding protein [Pseudomonadota bacterium]
MTGSPKIRVRNLTKSYGDTIVLERISLDIVEGSFCTIVGASGCGKSTFLRMLLSQEHPSSGEILLNDETLPKEPTPDRGIVFQKYSVFPHLTVEDNLILADEFDSGGLASRRFGSARNTARDQVTETLEKIGLAAARKRYPAQLSGGMQQRLAIAQALLKKPDVLLLDEPFGALDPGIRLDMHELLLELWIERGMTVFMVTHDIQEAFKLGTRLLVFDKTRHDPHQPERYGATITYDLPLESASRDSADTAIEIIRNSPDNGGNYAPAT